MTQVIVLSDYTEGELMQGINGVLSGFLTSRLIDIKYSTAMIPDNDQVSLTGYTIVHSAMIIYEE